MIRRLAAALPVVFTRSRAKTTAEGCRHHLAFRRHINARRFANVVARREKQNL
jgi:hypothetical protein